MNKIRPFTLPLLLALHSASSGGIALEFDSTAVYQRYAVNALGRLDIDAPWQKPVVFDAAIERLEGRVVYADFSGLPDVQLYAYVTDPGSEAIRHTEVISATASSITLASELEGLEQGGRLRIRPYLHVVDITASPSWPQLTLLQIQSASGTRRYSWRQGSWKDAVGNDASQQAIPPDSQISISNGRSDYLQRRVTLSGEVEASPWE